MSLYKQKGSAVWWMKFMFDGQVIRKSTKCTGKRDAAEVERAYRVQLAKREVGLEEPKPVPTFDVAMREFLDRARIDHAGKRNTTRRAETSSKALLRYFGKRRPTKSPPRTSSGSRTGAGCSASKRRIASWRRTSGRRRRRPSCPRPSTASWLACGRC